MPVNNSYDFFSRLVAYTAAERSRDARLMTVSAAQVISSFQHSVSFLSPNGVEIRVRDICRLPFGGRSETGNASRSVFRCGTERTWQVSRLSALTFPRKFPQIRACHKRASVPESDVTRIKNSFLPMAINSRERFIIGVLLPARGRGS